MASGHEGKKKKKQRQAQPASSNESKTEDTESQINLQAVLRLDSAALSIRFAASQVALYEFRASAWVKTDVEGTLFVYRRRSPPDHSFLLMSRLSNQNVMEPIAASLNLQIANNFLLYQSASNGIIYGLWVCDHAELHQLGKLMQQLIDEQEKATLAQQQQQPQPAQVTEQPLPSPTAGVNVLQMLNEAVRKAQTNTAAATSVTPTKPGKGSKSGGTPGAASQSRSGQKMANGHRGAAGQAASAPASTMPSQAGTPGQVVPMISSPWATQLPLPSHLGMAGASPVASAAVPTTVAAPSSQHHHQQQQQQQQAVMAGSMQSSYNVLMQDAAAPTLATITSVAAVEQHIASAATSTAVPVSHGAVAAHHPFSPSLGAATLPYRSPAAAATPVVVYSRCHSSSAAAALPGIASSPLTAAVRHQSPQVAVAVAGCNGFVTQPMATLAHPSRVGLPVSAESTAHVSSARAAIPTTISMPGLAPVAGKSDLMLPGDFQSSPGVDLKPLPQLGASPPPMEHVRSSSAAAGYKQQHSSSSLPRENLQGLTMEQMQQGLMYLVKNNPQFMHMLHAAYLDSLNPRTKSQ